LKEIFQWLDKLRDAWRYLRAEIKHKGFVFFFLGKSIAYIKLSWARFASALIFMEHFWILFRKSNGNSRTHDAFAVTAMCKSLNVILI